MCANVCMLRSQSLFRTDADPDGADCARTNWRNSPSTSTKKVCQLTRCPTRHCTYGINTVKHGYGVCLYVLQVMSMTFVQSVWMSMRRGRSCACCPVHMVSVCVNFISLICDCVLHAETLLSAVCLCWRLTERDSSPFCTLAEWTLSKVSPNEPSKLRARSQTKLRHLKLWVRNLKSDVLKVQYSFFLFLTCKNKLKICRNDLKKCWGHDLKDKCTVWMRKSVKLVNLKNLMTRNRIKPLAVLFQDGVINYWLRGWSWTQKYWCC